MFGAVTERDIKKYVDELLQARKEYLDSRIDSATTESIMRFEHMMQRLTDLDNKLETSIQTGKDDRERISDLLKQRFGEQERTAALVESKNQIRFNMIENDTQTIMATYALKDNVDKATLLAKQGVDAQFAANQRERDELNSRYKEAFQYFLTMLDQSSADAKERVDIAMKQTEAHVIAQAQAVDLAAKTVDLRFQGIDKATAIANASLEKRLESMNEFRDQLREQASRFVTREETEIKIRTFDPIVENVQNRISDLEKTKANNEGRMWAFGVVMTVISLGVSIGLHFIR